MKTTSCPSCSADVDADDIRECISCGDACCSGCSDMDECEVCIAQDAGPQEETLADVFQGDEEEQPDA